MSSFGKQKNVLSLTSNNKNTNQNTKAATKLTPS